MKEAVQLNAVRYISRGRSDSCAVKAVFQDKRVIKNLCYPRIDGVVLQIILCTCKRSQTRLKAKALFFYFVHVTFLTYERYSADGRFPKVEEYVLIIL